MSLSTVASTITPRQDLSHLPPARPERFQASDFIAAAIVFLVTCGVYIATLAPNVTLEDSGELITAATKFGVGHPPGYPLWTMAGFLLSHLFPFGNLAWRINLQSALMGGAANAVLTLLVCHSGRWLLQRWADEATQAVLRPFCFYVGMFAGLTIGFSDVMWSQAVISAVHGTLNALFINLVLLLVYLWLLEPQKTQRLIIAVFVFALGLTNHHTLIQIIPAILLAAGLRRAGKFWSVFLAVNLFSLSILVYLSWLSADLELQRICSAMAFLILGGTAAVSFFYLKEFQSRLFVIGGTTALFFFIYGNYFMSRTQFDVARNRWGSYLHPGWLQITSAHGVILAMLAIVALGLLFTSVLDRRLIIGVFVAGWVGLTPYAYESFASATHPPMNWGFASERAGFYYAVSREQYPMSLPNLIKDTIGKVIGIVPLNAQTDATIGRPHYFQRLWLTFYYYGDNLQQNFTVPLIFLLPAVLIYFRKCDWPQMNWFIFLGAAFFFVGFMLQLIEPQESFDFERNLQYRVFHLQSHCILVILIGYGLLALVTYLREAWPEVQQPGVALIGPLVLCFSLLPFWSNFDDCSQAGHWFGWMYGTDMMRSMAPNAVYMGGSDPGRFVPTYMAFVESQQDNHWKRDPSFDRRDITVITQNALCDTYYCHYIRNQYDARFRPKPDQYTPFEKWLGRDKAYPKEPVVCMSDQELSACWDEYAHQNAYRLGNGAPLLRPGSNDVFEINGLVAFNIFQKNKKNHTFYLEQSVPISWMYPYLIPFGLIFQLNPEPMKALPAGAVEADRKFWDDYSARLLRDPHFRPDEDATGTFAKLARFHADLYRYRHLDKEQEYWLKIAIRLCPQFSDAVNDLASLYAAQNRFDEGIALETQAQLDDPRNATYGPMLDWLRVGKTLFQQDKIVRDQLGKTAKSAYDVPLNLKLASLLQQEGKLDELNDRLHFVAGLTNWDQPGMANIVQYYVDKAHNPAAAIAFLEVRAKIDPKASQMIYSLAALHAMLNHRDEAIKYLKQASSAQGGTNALISARIDPRFQSLQDDPRFQALVNIPTPMPPATNAPPGKTPPLPPVAPSTHPKPPAR